MTAGQKRTGLKCYQTVLEITVLPQTQAATRQNSIVNNYLKGSLLGDNQIGEEKVVAQRGVVGESHPA